MALVFTSCSDPAFQPEIPDSRLQPAAPGALPTTQARTRAREILVLLRPNSDVQTLSATYDTPVLERIESASTFLLRVPSGTDVGETLTTLAADPAVRVAEPNVEVQYPEADRRREISQTFADGDSGAAAYAGQEALARIGAEAGGATAGGAGVLVAILDTGVDAAHPALRGRVARGIDLLEGDGDPADEGDGIDSDGDSEVDEAVGHGTFVAGLVLQVAPEARVLPVRVLDSDGVGTSFDVVRGLQAARRAGARVVNMSFGTSAASAVVDALIEDARNDGVILVASAGNQDSDRIKQFPARDSYVIGVAATDSLDRKAEFSSYGSWVDLSAPGVGLVSLFPQARYASWSGTSFAAALVSGAAALLLAENPANRQQEIADALEDGAVSLDARNPDLRGELGAGRLHVGRALEQLRD